MLVGGGVRAAHVVWVLSDEARVDELLRRVRGQMSAGDAAVARAIMLWAYAAGR